MKLSNTLAILMLITSSSIVPGCDIFGTRAVYVPPGTTVELATPQKFVGWVKNKETGKRERRTVEAQAGWRVGRPK